jgi:hypothetical protein
MKGTILILSCTVDVGKIGKAQRNAHQTILLEFLFDFAPKFSATASCLSVAYIHTQAGFKYVTIKTRNELAQRQVDWTVLMTKKNQLIIRRANYNLYVPLIVFELITLTLCFLSG